MELVRVRIRFLRFDKLGDGAGSNLEVLLIPVSSCSTSTMTMSID